MGSFITNALTVSHEDEDFMKMMEQEKGGITTNNLNYMEFLLDKNKVIIVLAPGNKM